MSWQTNSILLILRNVGRNLGFNKWVANIRRSKGYEKRYEKSLLNAIGPGDCVWDVGANVGYYTKLFSDRVGHSGRVFAFEPSPINFARLASNCAYLRNVTLLCIGLGKEDKKLCLLQGADDLGATSRFVEYGMDGEIVEIRSGSNLINDVVSPIPNAIKIDVEGYEQEVLAGLLNYIKSPELRLIGVEVHFGLLKERGMQFAPKWIEGLLSSNGFKIRWPDSSHILAIRAT